MTLNPFIPQRQISLTPVDNPHYQKKKEKEKERTNAKEHGDTLCLNIFLWKKPPQRFDLLPRFHQRKKQKKEKVAAAAKRKRPFARTKFDEAGPLAPGPCRFWLGWLSKAWKSTVSAPKWKGRLWRRHLLGYRLNFIGGTRQQFAITPCHFSLNRW